MILIVKKSFAVISDVLVGVDLVTVFSVDVVTFEENTFVVSVETLGD